MDYPSGGHWRPVLIIAYTTSDRVTCLASILFVLILASRRPWILLEMFQCVVMDSQLDDETVVHLNVPPDPCS